MLEGNYFDEDDGRDFGELMDYVGRLMECTIENVDDLLRWIIPSVDRKLIHEIKLRSFLYCLNVAAYDLKLCEELKSLYGESKAFENHRRYMIKIIVDWCRKATCTLTSGANSQQSACSQPMNKITKLDAQDSAFLRAVKECEKSRNTPQHRTWCKLFLDFDIE